MLFSINKHTSELIIYDGWWIRGWKKNIFQPVNRNELNKCDSMKYLYQNSHKFWRFFYGRFVPRIKERRRKEKKQNHINNDNNFRFPQVKWINARELNFKTESHGLCMCGKPNQNTPYFIIRAKIRLPLFSGQANACNSFIFAREPISVSG